MMVSNEKTALELELEWSSASMFEVHIVSFGFFAEFSGDAILLQIHRQTDR